MFVSFIGLIGFRSRIILSFQRDIFWSYRLNCSTFCPLTEAESIILIGSWAKMVCLSNPIFLLNFSMSRIFVTTCSLLCISAIFLPQSLIYRGIKGYKRWLVNNLIVFSKGLLFDVIIELDLFDQLFDSFDSC